MIFVEEIYIAGSAGEPMLGLEEVRAIQDRGLEGDRYLLGTGRFCPRDVCQVTLISAESLEEVSAKFDVQVEAGQHRRNLVVRGIDVEELRGLRFAIGEEVVMDYDRLRPPCGYLERITENGMTRALGSGGAGVAVNVITGGMIRRGDELRVLPGATPKPVRRLP